MHEDDHGNLFANMKQQVAGKKKAFSRSIAVEEVGNGDRWALASIFGEDQHVLWRLRDEARHLLASAVAFDGSRVSTNTYKYNGTIIKGAAQDKDEQSTETPPLGGEDGDLQPRFQREALASLDVPFALALAEHSEQQKCKDWCQRILRQSDHPKALVSGDAYSTPLLLDNGSSSARTTAEMGPKDGDSSSILSSKSDQGEDPASVGSIIKNNTNSIRPLVERGMDRLWLAHLVEKVSSSNSNDNDDARMSQSRNKDTLMSFECKSVSSVANAMASLQKC